MGARSSAMAAPDLLTEGNVPDASLSSNITTVAENEAKKKSYANLKSAAAAPSTFPTALFSGSSPPPRQNVIEQVYNEDFETIDHIQAMRLPPYVSKQIKDAVRNECERRCAEKEKTMARCLQDKMWTSWKCQKERDAYYYCVQDEERRNSSPSHPDQEPEGAAAGLAAKDDGFVDLLTAYRWKFNLGVLHGEIIGRNKVMRKLWKEHFPDRELPHPWVKDEE